MRAEFRYYPIALNLKNRRVVVIGGGRIATRKIAELLPTGARVTVISPEISSRLARWAKDGRLEHCRRVYRPGDLKGACLAVAATSLPAAHRPIAAEARRRAVWLNVVDEPVLCDFIAPAVIRRGDLTITISTGGRNPALARCLKEMLQGTIGEEYGRLTAALGAIRDGLREAGVPPATRSRLVERLIASPLLAQLRRRDRPAALRTIRRVTGLATVALPRMSPPRLRSPHGLIR
ncbi:MAG: bifunctional precorrin-2 dehydrogenase/sirohydrochlorin ferrochelatase [Nitrospiria bacterium]